MIVHIFSYKNSKYKIQAVITFRNATDSGRNLLNFTASKVYYNPHSMVFRTVYKTMRVHK